MVNVEIIKRNFDLKNIYKVSYNLFTNHEYIL